MARPKRTTEEEWYDVFASWDETDQDVAIRVLEQMRRQARRRSKAAVLIGTQPSLTGLPDEDQTA